MSCNEDASVKSKYADFKLGGRRLGDLRFCDLPAILAEEEAK